MSKSTNTKTRKKSVKKDTKKNIKKPIIISVAVLLIVVFIVIKIISLNNAGGLYGLKVRDKIWTPIEGLLNYYTEDDYKVIEQTKEGVLLISFGDDERMSFSCKENARYQGLPGSYTTCSMEIGDNKVNSIGKYYAQKNRAFIDNLVNNTAGIETIPKQDAGKYWISYDNLDNLKEFFYKMEENDDFHNLYSMSEKIESYSDGRVYSHNDGEYYTVNYEHPSLMVDSNMISTVDSDGNVDDLIEVAKKNKWTLLPKKKFIIR